MHTWTDTIGYFAAFLLVLTFFMRNMIQLRITAICSSLAWLVYGWVDTLYPVIVLHSVLLPLNSYQLWQDLHRPR
jgi:CRP/FNR family transcriptional regulator, cyclic AMP receptor protein